MQFKSEKEQETNVKKIENLNSQITQLQAHCKDLNAKTE